MLDPIQAKSKLSNFRDREFREGQLEAIDFIMNSSKKVKILQAPCGTGKSLIGVVCAMMAGQATYLVQSKFLQTQIVNDFDNFVSVWGRNNYKCLLNNYKTCAECISMESNPCPKKGVCLYFLAKQRAIEANFRILNFQYFLSETTHVGRFSGNVLTIVDEADALEPVLSSGVCLEFTERGLYRLGLTDGPGRKTPNSKDGLTSWIAFGEEALQRSSSVIKEMKHEIDDIDNADNDLKLRKLKELEYFVHINERCRIFLNSVDKSWIFEEIPRRGSQQGKMVFKPTWLSPDLAQKYFWRLSDSFVLMSATFLPIPILAKQLGLDTDDIDYIVLPSTFDPERSPVHICPVADVTTKNMTLAIPVLIKAIKTILSRHKGERGIIHAVSWKLCKEIIDGVNSSRIITHTSESRQEVIGEFMKIDGNFAKDAVLCSPSSERGVDLKDDLCRFSILVKCPFLSIGDKLVSSRIHSGKVGQLWYQADAMATVEQCCGRATRNSDDYSVTYILDSQINKLYTQKPSLWSKSFQGQISWETVDLLDENKLIESED